MSGIKDLYELQSLDLTLDQNRGRLNQIAGSLGRNDEIMLLKQELTRQENRQREALENQAQLDIGISEFNTEGFYFKVPLVVVGWFWGVLEGSGDQKPPPDLQKPPRILQKSQNSNEKIWTSRRCC